MSQKSRVVIGLAMLVVAGGLAYWFLLPATGSRQMMLKVSGPAGVRVAVTCDANGNHHAQEHDLPCELTFTTHKLEFKVERVGAPGNQFKVEMFADGVLRGAIGSLRGAQGVLEYQGGQAKQSSVSGLGTD